jgi:isoleucyl-tRNA synthetase
VHALVAPRPQDHALLRGGGSKDLQDFLGRLVKGHAAQLQLDAPGLAAREDEFALLQRYREDLPTLFIASRVTLSEAEPAASADNGGVSVAVVRTAGTKCVRCWRYVQEVAQDEVYTGLCDRCVDAVRQPASTGTH